MRVLRLVFSLCVTMLTPNALAWGAQGHRITGWVADGFLSTHTRIEINHLLEGTSLADAATWMDEEKRHLGPSIARWHYTNIEVCSLDEVRCPAGNCLHERLPQQLQILGDRGAPSETRKRALLMVIHLVGDLHQPLHVADHHDRGGNDTHVVFQGARNPLARNLHEFWDVELVKMSVRGYSERAYAEALVEEARPKEASVSAGSIDDWLRTSNRYARDTAYGAIPGWQCASANQSPYMLDGAYVQHARTIVQRQLMNAGVRLAHLLNERLDR